MASLYEALPAHAVEQGQRILNWKMVFNAFKAIVGAGGLSFPKALGDMGLVPFCITLLLVAVLADASLSWLATVAFRTTVSTGIHGMIDRTLKSWTPCVQCVAALYSLSACAGYIAFTHEALCNALSIMPGSSESAVVLLTVGLCSAGLVVMRWHSPNSISYFSSFGDAAIVVGYVVAFAAAREIRQGEPTGARHPALPMYTDMEQYFQSAGKIIFLFCSHFTLATLMEERPADFRRAGRIAIFAGMLVNGAFGLVVGSLLYPNAHNVVYVSFRGSGMVRYCVAAEMLVSLDLMCTLPLQAEPGLLAFKANGLWTRLVFSAIATVVSTMGFGIVINLAGATACLAGAFVFPPMMMMQLVARRSHWVGYLAMIMASVAFAAFTCVITVRQFMSAS